MRTLLFFLTACLLLFSFEINAKSLCRQWFNNSAHSNNSANILIEKTYQEEVNKLLNNSEVDSLVLIDRLKKNDSPSQFLKYLGFRLRIKNHKDSIEFPTSVIDVLKKIDRIRRKQILKGLINEHDSITAGVPLSSTAISFGDTEVIYLTNTSSPNSLNKLIPVKGDLSFQAYSKTVASGIIPIGAQLAAHDIIGHSYELLRRPQLAAAIRNFYRNIQPRLSNKSDKKYLKAVQHRSVIFGEFLSLPDLSKREQITELMTLILPKIKEPSYLELLDKYTQKLLSNELSEHQILEFLRSLEPLLINTGGGINDGYSVRQYLDSHSTSHTWSNASSRNVYFIEKLQNKQPLLMNSNLINALNESIVGSTYNIQLIFKIINQPLTRETKEYLRLIAHYMAQIHLQLYWALHYNITDIKIINESFHEKLPTESLVRKYFEKIQPNYISSATQAFLQ